MKKKVTMKDIAEVLGVSVNAVSLALNGKPGVSEETRRNILRTANEIGYIDFSSRYDKTFSDACVCVIIKKKSYGSGFYTKIIYGVESEAKRHGYNLTLQFYEDSQKMPTCILKRKVCGVIIIGQLPNEYLDMVYRTGLPTVLVDHSSHHVPVDCILTGNKSGVVKSMTHLIRCGYRKIGFFGDYSYSSSFKERFDGYLEAMQKLCPDLKELFRTITRWSVLEQIEDLILRRDTLAIAKILETMEELPEAFQCANDQNAFILNNALQYLGYKVPEDVAVVGFDDGDLAKIAFPPLTTLHISTVQMGIKAFQRLLWRLDHREVTPEKIVMNVELRVRESTKNK